MTNQPGLAHKNYYEKYILTSFLFLFWFNAFSQKIELSSVDSLAEVAWDLRTSDPDSALKIIPSLINIIQPLNQKKRESYFWNIMGIATRSKGQFNQAKKYFANALSIRQILNDSLGIASIHNNLGSLYNMESKHDSALIHLYKALDIYQSSQKPYKAALAYSNIANTYENEKAFDKAKWYHKESALIYHELGDSLGWADIQYNVAIIHFQKNQFDSASLILLNTIKTYEALNEWKGIADAYGLLGQINNSKKKFIEAELYYNNAISFYQQHAPSHYDLFSLYLNMGNLFFHKKIPQKGINYLNKAKKILGKDGGIEDLWLLNENYNMLYIALGIPDSALYYKSKSEFWKDSIYNKQKANAVIKYEELFESEKKDNQILSERLKTTEFRNQRNLLSYLVTFFLLLTVMVFLYFRQKQKAAKTIAEQKQKIHQQEVGELLKTQELTAINAMLEGQEKERFRIAKDLHDRLGSMLTTVKWSFDGYLEKENIKGENTTLVKASHLLDDAYQEVRKIAHNMVSGVLTKFGLIPALLELAKTITDSGKMKVQLIHTGLDGRLESGTEITIYRIIQELLSNVLKHAAAQTTVVQLNRHEGSLHLSVEDDGVGFDPDTTQTGMGLKNIEARVQSLNGTFFIDSSKGNGSTIMIEIPMAKND